MKEINSSSFKQEVLQSDLPVLEEYAGKVKMVKLNVDQSPELASSFGINSIPALLYFQGGQVKGSSVGLASKADLERKLNAWGRA